MLSSCLWSCRFIQTRDYTTLNMHTIIIVLAMLNGVISDSEKLLGYDCSYNDADYVTIDLTETQKCQLPTENITSTTWEIQLLQLTSQTEISVYVCNIEIHRTISHCGMHSHASAVRGGVLTYPYRVSRDRCLKAIRTGELCLFCQTGQQIIFANLQVGQSIFRPQVFAGSVDEASTCAGAPYSDSFGSWKDVVVQGYVKITLSIVPAAMNLETSTVHMPQGITCSSKENACMDASFGEAYWDPIPLDNCYSSKHLVLYEGPSNRTLGYSPEGKEGVSLITVVSQDISFSLQLIRPHSLCNFEAYITEHPKLIIIRKTGMGFMFKKTKVQASSYDLFTYINSKFVFFQRSVQENTERLYRKMIENICRMEDMALQSKLIIAQFSPQEFAYLYHNSPGYTGVRLGEVIYVIKCTSVFVQIRKTEKCFQEIPIMYMNKTRFLTPRSKLIQTHGNEISCNNIFAPKYKFGKKWYQIYGATVETSKPMTLSPSTDEMQWNYNSIRSLATSGIYTQEDLESLREHIMFGLERGAIENVIVRSTAGQAPDMQGISGMNLLSDGDLNKVAERVGERAWRWFTTFGNISAGMIGLFSIVKLIKWIVDSLINGTLLYKLYGFSYHLIGCVLDSVTHCLVFYKREEIRKTTEDKPDSPPDMSITVDNYPETNAVESGRTKAHLSPTYIHTVPHAVYPTTGLTHPHAGTVNLYPDPSAPFEKVHYSLIGQPDPVCPVEHNHSSERLNTSFNIRTDHCP